MVSLTNGLGPWLPCRVSASPAGMPGPCFVGTRCSAIERCRQRLGFFIRIIFAGFRKPMDRYQMLLSSSDFLAAPDPLLRGQQSSVTSSTFPRKSLHLEVLRPPGERCLQGLWKARVIQTALRMGSRALKNQRASQPRAHHITVRVIFLRLVVQVVESFQLSSEKPLACLQHASTGP